MKILFTYRQNNTTGLKISSQLKEGCLKFFQIAWSNIRSHGRIELQTETHSNKCIPELSLNH